MSCTYYLKGHKFDNEALLTSFLIEKYPYMEKFGDLVFSLSAEALGKRDIILNKVAPDGKKYEAILDRCIDKTMMYDEEGKIQYTKSEPPAVGVNKFLLKLLDKDGHHILKEFRDKEFWVRKREAWGKGNFTDEEIELICLYQHHIDPNSSWIVNGLPNLEYLKTQAATKDKNLFDSWQNLIQTKWTSQGRVGSALHKVSEVFFGSEYNGTPVWQYFELNPDEDVLKRYWENEFLNLQVDKYNKDLKINQFINYEQFKEMFRMVLNLKAQIELEKGECMFFPELTVSGAITADTDNCTRLLGIIDLLVIDSKGAIHIYDYKTSPKDYSKYNREKSKGFKLQLGTYSRILKQYGLYAGDSGTLNIIPIKLNDFHLEFDDNDPKFRYTNISYLDRTTGNVRIENITESVRLDKDIDGALDQFMPEDTKVSGYAENLLDKVQTIIHKFFPNYMTNLGKSNEEIAKLIEDEGGFKPNGANQYWFKGYQQDMLTVNANEPNAKEKLIDLVRQDIDQIKTKRLNLADNFITNFKAAVSTGLAFEWKVRFGTLGSDSLFITNTITPYCDGTYEVVETIPELKYLGIVILQNKRTGTCIPIKLTNADIFEEKSITKSRHNLNANFASDVSENSNPNSLILKSYRGNIEAIEAMVALQCVNWQNPLQLEGIKVLCPSLLHELPVKNKELIYNFNLLCKQANLNIAAKDNQFLNGKLNLMDDLVILRSKFDEIRSLLNDSNRTIQPNGNKTASLSSTAYQTIAANDLFMQGIPTNKEEAIAEITALMRSLELSYPLTLTKIGTTSHDLNLPEVKLYNQLSQALLSLKGITIRLQVKDSAAWLDSTNILQGAEGLNIENPGNFRSDALNQITKSIKNVHQKVRDIVLKRSYKNLEMVAKLKKEQGFTGLKNKFLNLTSLYDGMTKVTEDGDFVFVNPDELSGAKREFLKYVLYEINIDRFSEDEGNFEAWEKSGELKYYRVPLLAASIGSRWHTLDLLSNFKETCKNYTPSNILTRTQELVDNANLEPDEITQDVFKVANIYQASENETARKALIAKMGIDAFEHNLENILIHHQYLYTRHKEMLKEMPFVKASALAIAVQGGTANPANSLNFLNLLKFVEDYVITRINHKSLDSRFTKPAKTLGKLRGVTSLLALGFSPVQWTRQKLEGIWKGIALIIKKPDGTNAFTFKNMFEAWKELEKEVFDYSGKPTVNSRLNELYGINDMDSTLYADRMSSDKSIFTHLYDLAFRFTSRPDYYNRMMIFKAKMKNDGCEKAHYINDKGELVYDWTLDDRVAAYAKIANTKKPISEYTAEERLAYSNYVAIAQELVAEGVYNEDGTLFKFGQPLPRAYSNREASAIKSIGDNIYGYYNDEDKSMINNMFLGGLVMQMKNYWSAKKNQYLAPGGVKLQGKWADYLEELKNEDGTILVDENGNPIKVYMCYAKTNEGLLDITRMVPEGSSDSSGVRVLRWEGQWLEGVIVTLANFTSNWKDKGFKTALHEAWDNPDPNMRTMVQSNIKHLGIDLFCMLFFGWIAAAALRDWDEDEKKEFNKDKSDTEQAFRTSTVHLLTNTLTNSFLDFNMIKSIGDPLTQWNPFAFESFFGLIGDSWDVVKGDNTVLNLTTDHISAVRTVKPLLINWTYDPEREYEKRIKREQERLEKEQD